MGAVIAAAFASGASYDEVVIAARSLSRRDVAPLDPIALLKGAFAGSILKAQGPRRAIERLVPATRFEQLKSPLTITATDLDSGELLLFGTGGRSDLPLHDALYASCALPLYFPPLSLDGRRFGDGGLRAVLGLEPASKIPADLVVAIHVGPGFDEPAPTSRAPVPALVRAHGEAIRVMMAAQVERQIADWPKDAPPLVLVRPIAEREATFAVASGDRYLQAGYAATKRALADRLDRC